MADLDYLDCQKANSLFCFRGWGWGQQYGIYKILMNGLWSAPPVTIGNGQPTIAKLTFLLRPKENQKNLTKRSFSLPLPRFHAIQKPSTAATKVFSVPMEFK